MFENAQLKKKLKKRALLFVISSQKNGSTKVEANAVNVPRSFLGCHCYGLSQGLLLGCGVLISDLDVLN